VSGGAANVEMEGERRGEKEEEECQDGHRSLSSVALGGSVWASWRTSPTGPVFAVL